MRKNGRDDACPVTHTKTFAVHEGLEMHCLFFVVDMYDGFFRGRGKLSAFTFSPSLQWSPIEAYQHCRRCSTLVGACGCFRVHGLTHPHLQLVWYGLKPKYRCYWLSRFRPMVVGAYVCTVRQTSLSWDRRVAALRT